MRFESGIINSDLRQALFLLKLSLKSDPSAICSILSETGSTRSTETISFLVFVDKVIVTFTKSIAVDGSSCCFEQI